MSNPEDPGPTHAPLAPRPWPHRGAGDSPLRGRSVLVVEPDGANAARLADLLAAEGADVCQTDGRDLAGRVDEAWEIALVAPQVPGTAALVGGPLLLSLAPRPGEPLELPPEQVFAYLARDADAPALRHALGRALEQRGLADENAVLRRRLVERYAFGRIVTRDPAMQSVLATVESVADTHATVLLLGESGTGKTLLARAIHHRSERADAPFVVVNCGALPPTLLESELFGHVRGAFSGAVRDRMGRFAQADEGTLLLDEINSASPDLQVKLLRVLQDRTFERVGDGAPQRVDVRVVAASNSDLQAEVAAGRFREDLYWRIDVVAVELPPLRERPGDLPLLAEHFLRRFAAEYGKGVARIHPDALSVLAACAWPGNVRQLANALERAVLMAKGEVLLPADLAPELQEEAVLAGALGSAGGGGGLLQGLENLTRLPPLRQALEGPERQIILRALELCGGSRRDTARMLAINRTTLFNKMRKYDLLDLTFEPR